MDASAARNSSRCKGFRRTAAELNFEQRKVRMSPGRIYGRVCGQKFFQVQGAQEDCSGTQFRR